MRTPTLLAALLALSLVATPLAAATYWNYGWYAVTVGGEDHVKVEYTSCAGDGIPAPLLVVSSAPNPFEDCYKDPLTFQPIDLSDELELVQWAIDRGFAVLGVVLDAAGDVVGIVLGIAQDPPVGGDGGTYWNYGFYYVHYNDGEVDAGYTSCAGYGIQAPLLVVSSAPNPFEDCYKEPLVFNP